MEPYSAVALCLSPKGERYLEAAYNVFANDHPDQAEDVRKGLFEPLGVQRMEIHRFHGSVLRIWARIQWSSDQLLPAFLRQVSRELEPSAFALCQFDHGLPSPISILGSYVSNPFQLTLRREFSFRVADGGVQTSCARYYDVPEAGMA